MDNNPIPENKVGSGEFEDTMRDFESSFAKEISGPKTREAREFWKHRAFYQDGHVNSAFIGFLNGIAYARNLVNLASYDPE